MKKQMDIGRFKLNPSSLIGKYGVYLAFFVLVIILSLTSDVFLTPRNITNIFKQISVVGVMAVGMTFVIAAGGIDLSVGAVSALAGCVACSLSQGENAKPLVVALLVGVAIGVACGAFSGLVVAYFNVPAFITTLATTTIARGIVYVYTNGYPVTNVTKAYQFIGGGKLFGTVPLLIVLYIFIVLIGGFVLHFTSFGRHIFAVGGNEKAAIVSGINSKKVSFSVYVISGACAAIAGILLSSRVQTGAPASGVGYESDAITAVVMGGASLSGGRGTVIGAVIGMLIVGTLSNGMDLLNISSYYQQIVKGAIILLAVLADSKKNASSR